MNTITRSTRWSGKRLGIMLAAFGWLSLSLAPAYASDTEVYVTDGSGGTGTSSLLNPNVVLMLDNSGSMDWSILSSSSTSVIKDKRQTHMKDGARSLLTSAKGTTRVGVGTYFYKMLTGTKPLNTVVGTYAGGSGTVDMSIDSADNDVVQQAQDGSPNTASGQVITSTSTLDIARGQQPGPLAPTPTYTALSPTKSLLDNIYDRVGNNAGGGNGSVKNQDDCSVYSSGGGKNKRYYANICKDVITVPTKDDDGVTPLDAWYVTFQADNNCYSCSNATNNLTLRQDSFNGAIVATDSGNRDSDPAVLNSVKLTAGKTYYLIVGTNANGDTGKVHVSANVVAKDYRPLVPSTTNVNQRIGLRFNSVPIPSGATISSAYLYFYASEDSASRPNVTIGVDKTTNPASFGDAAANNLYDRPNLTFYGSGQNTSAWSASCRSSSLSGSGCLDKQKYDVGTAVQSLVSQTGWCGGDMVFVLKGDDPAKVAKALSYDGNPAYAPRLVVNYTSSSSATTGCKTINATTEVSTEDASQNVSVDALPDLNSTTLQVGDTSMLGLRFTDLHIYPDTSANPVTVQDAYLELNVASNSNPGKLRISIDQSGISQGFSTKKNDIGRRLSPSSAYVDWDVSSDPNWKAGNKVRSPNIKALLQQILDRGQAADSTLDQWEYGGAFGLLIQGLTPNKSGAVYSFDYFINSGTRTTDYGTKAPRLVVTLSGKIGPENKTHRDYLIEQVEGMSFPNNTPLISTYYELARYFTGSSKDLYSGTPISDVYDGSKYISPIDNGWDDGSACQSNNLVLLTDGEPTADGSLNLNTKISSFTGQTCSSSSSGLYWDCANKLADYLVGHDGPKVTTHTIGLGPDVSGLQGLKDIATHGKGSYLAASDAGALAGVFSDILNSVTYESSSLAAPGVAVNQLNRFQHLSQVYYSVFKPSEKQDWAGNLKRYKLQLTTSGPTILDSLGNPAIDDATNFFIEGSKSYWSVTADGPNVDIGGAASHMADDFANRRVFTFIGSNPAKTADQVSLISADSSNSSQFTASVFGTSDSSATNLAALLAWVRGDDGTGNPRNLWGAPIHGQPVLVNYGYSGTDVAAAQVNEDLQYNDIFLSTNEGYLHAIDSSTGKEIFSFIPQEMLKNVEALKQNNSGKLLDGMDASWVVWRHDENDDQKITTGASGDWVYVFGGMREGGRNYYSLDVTAAHPTATPAAGDIKLRFVLTGGASGTAYKNMGYTWSVPSLGRVKYVTTSTDGSGNTVRVDHELPVMFFGGGYDHAHERAGDTNGVSDSTLSNTQDSMGNQLYMVNAQTGELVWWASNDIFGAARNTSATYKFLSAMKWAIPSTIKTLDKDGDGYVDNLYFGDLGGQVWRVDIDNDAPTQASIVKRIKRIGSFGRVESATMADNRRFYEAPSVAFFTDTDGSRYLGVAMGSGYRSHPLFTDTAERFYFLKDKEVTKLDLLTSASYDTESPIKVADLADLTTATDANSADAALVGKQGWYLRLDNVAAEDKGEKVLSSPVIYQGAIVFTTYLPGSNRPVCGSLRGRSRFWSIAATNAVATTDFNNDGIVGDGTNAPSERYRDYAGNGMLGTPQIVTDGTNAGALTNGGGGEALPPPPDNGVQRLRWYEKKN